MLSEKKNSEDKGLSFNVYLTSLKYIFDDGCDIWHLCQISVFFFLKYNS